jgi:hypothetical protein
VEAGEWAIRQQEMGDVIREACGTAVKHVFDNQEFPQNLKGP